MHKGEVRCAPLTQLYYGVTQFFMTRWRETAEVLMYVYCRNELFCITSALKIDIMTSKLVTSAVTGV